MGCHRACYSIMDMKPLGEVSSLCRLHPHPHSAKETTGFKSTLARLSGFGVQDPLALGNFCMWLHMIESVHNFWVLLDSWLLLEQVSAVASGRVFAYLQLHFGHQFQVSAHSDSYPGHVQSGLQIQGLHGSTLDQHLEASAVQTVMGVFYSVYVIPLLCKLYYLPIYFKVQLKLQVMTYKAFHCRDPNYFQGCLSTVVST